MEDGGERWSKPYVATLSLHSLFELRSCILNGTVLLDMRATTIEEIAGQGPRAAGPAPPAAGEAALTSCLCPHRHGDRRDAGGRAAGGEPSR